MASTRFLDDTGISRFDLAREDGMWGVDTMTDVSLPDLSHEDRVAFESAQFCSRRWEEYDGECSTMVCRVDDAQELADMLKGVFDRQQPVPAIADDKEAAFDFIDRKSFSSSCRDSHQMHFQSENVHSTKQQHAQLNLPVQNAKLRLQHSDEMVGVASSTVSDNLTVLPAPFDVVPAENQNERRISNCRSLFDGPADIRQEPFNSIPCMFSHGGNTDEVCKVQFPSHCESEATDRKNMPMASDDRSYDEVSCCNMYKTFESVAMNARSVSTGSVPGGLNDDYSLCSISGGITGMSSPTRNRARKELLPSMQIVSTELPETAVFGVVGDGDKLLNEHKAANHPHAETLSFENINTQCRLIYPDRNCIRDVVAGGDASNKDCIAPILDESLLSAEGQMKQMQREALYAAAAMQPIDWTGLLAMSVGARPKRRNVRISHDPQTASARKRRERISERIRVLQRMVPGGTKMDTASMLDEAIHYLKYLKSQIQALEYLEKRTSRPSLSTRSVPFAPCLFSNLNISNLQPSPSSTLIS